MAASSSQKVCFRLGKEIVHCNVGQLSAVRTALMPKANSQCNFESCVPGVLQAAISAVTLLGKATIHKGIKDRHAVMRTPPKLSRNLRSLEAAFALLKHPGSADATIDDLKRYLHASANCGADATNSTVSSTRASVQLEIDPCSDRSVQSFLGNTTAVDDVVNFVSLDVLNEFYDIHVAGAATQTDVSFPPRCNVLCGISCGLQVDSVVGSFELNASNGKPAHNTHNMKLDLEDLDTSGESNVKPTPDAHIMKADLDMLGASNVIHAPDSHIRNLDLDTIGASTVIHAPDTHIMKLDHDSLGASNVEPVLDNLAASNLKPAPNTHIILGASNVKPSTGVRSASNSRGAAAGDACIRAETDYSAIKRTAYHLGRLEAASAALEDAVEDAIMNKDGFALKPLGTALARLVALSV